MLQNLKNPLIPVTGLGLYENHGHVGQVAEKNDNFFTNHKSDSKLMAQIQSYCAHKILNTNTCHSANR